MEGWRSFGARSRSSEREESGHGDDGWSARTPVRRAAVLGLHGSAAVRGMETEWNELEASRAKRGEEQRADGEVRRMLDAWRLAGVQTPVWASGVHTGSAGAEQ